MAVVTEARAAKGWRWSAERAVRTLAPITVAGAVLGVLVGGVGGRLAMKVLAVVNPAASGLRSDDGFTIGQFTLPGTVNLLAAGWFLGMIGAAFYTLLRRLMIGPAWFRIISISVGPGVVVGSMLVHSDGVDFTLLHPLWLTTGLFIAIPTVFAALLSLLAEHWLRTPNWFARARLRWVCLPFLLWLPAAPLLPILLAAHLLTDRLSQQRRPLATTAAPWLSRAALTAVFLIALNNLTNDLKILM